MPRKRKAESVSPADNSVVDSADTEVRRSRRISAKDISREVRRREVEEEDSSSPGMDRSVSPDHSSISTVFEGDGVVQHAVEGLAKLQRNLQREARRRKREVQQSNVPTRPESLEPGKPPGSPGGASTVVPRMRKMPTDPGPAPQDGAEKGGYEATAATAEGKQREAEFTSMEDDKGADVGAARPPAVNSSYLPLPWKGRLGYACLNTYLRTANPPVFSSRTCRTASILEHRHPLRDPSMPEHATKNRPDKTQEAVEELGHKFVQNLGLANARDIVKMIRWNDKYGIKFMRLSSEMFPFASHLEYGYRLAPFASEVLAEAGKVIAELGHRVTMHPGQFTQLGSPREVVVAAAIRDLEYHDELLSLLKLPPQQDRDAVLILHMGGTYGDKAATLDRFRHNYTTRLSPSIQARLVLENDDVSWSVHDLLPVCEELSIPLVLDFHHHNIIFDARHVREGTLDVSRPELADRIAATWRRKGITQKMHYSEPRAGAVSRRDRRAHANRVATLPPCPPDMDLMIEAKDKEQAVFELMRNFRLPGFEKINDMIPHEREDEEKRPVRGGAAAGKKRKRKGKQTRGAAKADEEEDEEDNALENDGEVKTERTVSPEDFGMGGPQNRVYWPPGMEDWLKPKKVSKQVQFDT